MFYGTRLVSERILPDGILDSGAFVDVLVLAWFAGICGLFVYWAYCAHHVFATGKEELSDADVESMRWTRRMRTRLSRR